jgi:tRNA dimethylallyltransferase
VCAFPSPPAEVATRTHLALVGPTASGKSALALALAEQLGDVEIVSVDSMQLYRGLDVGTAKPTAEERARVRHHMLDLAEPTEDWSVAQFQDAARTAVRDIEARGRRALLVGGTGLYVRAVVDNLKFPGEDAAIRARIDGRADEPDGLAALYAELAQRDPAAAARIEPGNRRRIVRALEVIELTGEPFSASGVGLEHHGATVFPVRMFAVWLPSDVLLARIDARVDEMYAAGLVDEAKALAHRYPTGLSRTAGQAIGYREAFAVAAGVVDQDAARAATALRTRQFGRRQVRWFRRDPRITWFGAARNPADLGPALLECCSP